MADDRVRRVLMWVGIPVGATALVIAAIVIAGPGDSEAAAGTEPTSSPDASDSNTEPKPAESPCRPRDADPCAVDLGDELVLTTTSATMTDNGDGTATVTGDLELGTEAGGITIDDAELIVEIPEDGGPAEIVGGTADVPFPKLGFLEQAEIIGTSTGLFGTDYGRDIQHLGVPAEV